MKFKYLILMFLLLLTQQAYAEQLSQDPLETAANLIKDGFYDRAKEVLAKVDVEIEPFDYRNYYTLAGILNHHRGYAKVSNIFIHHAIEQGQDNPSILLYQAKNYWQLKDYKKVIAVLDKAGETAKQEPQMFTMKAESYKALEQYRDAWAVLDEGIVLFPEHKRFLLQKFYYLMELGFYQKALDYADRFLEQSDYTEKEYISVAYAMRSNGQLYKAAQLLEGAVLRHPNNEQLIELLGQVYIDQELYLAAATVFDRASIRSQKFSHKAAQLYLKANQPVRSLQLNRKIMEQREKFKQRLSIDLYLEDYESLVAKTEAFKRYGLLKEDDILYAVGYAFYRNQDYPSAVHYLKKINDSELFARASSIFSIIEKCQDEPVQCI